MSSIRQMSMHKPVCPNMATATPLGSPGPDGAKAARRVAQAGRAASAARIRLPEGAARKVSASVRRAYIPDARAASGPQTGNLQGS
jgi:hypothetical protein